MFFSDNNLHELQNTEFERTVINFIKELQGFKEDTGNNWMNLKKDNLWVMLKKHKHRLNEIIMTIQNM